MLHKNNNLQGFYYEFFRFSIIYTAYLIIKAVCRKYFSMLFGKYKFTIESKFKFFQVDVTKAL